MKYLYLPVVFAAIFLSAFAEELTPLDPGPKPLSTNETEALALAKTWLQAPDKPLMAADGKITFLYGSSMPTLFCSPFYNSDIELEPGERIRDGGINLGDTVRWVASPSTSGPDDALVTHILLKPKDVNLATTLFIMTDRRTYALMLKSSADHWTPRLSFEYPKQPDKLWANYHSETKKNIQVAAVVEAQQPVSNDGSNLDFGYSIKGTASWKPVRVYNDGAKTYIQMPKSMEQTEAPALLVVTADNAEALVNYRLLNGRFVVDQLFDKAVLVAGVGRKQTKITIARSAP